MKYLKLYEDYFDKITQKSDAKSREIVIGGILKRGNGDYGHDYLNKSCQIKWIGRDILQLRFPYYEIPFIKKSLYFDYEVNFIDNELKDKNILGKTYKLTQDEADQIFNKYYYH